MVLDIVPTNFLASLSNTNMLQILFVAIFMGIAAMKVNDNEKLISFLNKANDWFMAAVGIVAGMLKVSMFCALASLMLSLGSDSLAGFAGLLAESAVTDVVTVLGVYSVAMLVIGRINPLKFIKKLFPTLTMALSVLSSNGMIPNMMKACKEFNIPQKVYSFSIPLGSTVNMDASCIFQTICVLFMAKSFGIEFSAFSVVTTLISIVLLSLGSPGVTGGSLASLAILLPMVGVPADAVNLLIVPYSLISYIQCPCNLIGDAAVTAIMAKKETNAEIDLD